jgi:hypothetical protein
LTDDGIYNIKVDSNNIVTTVAHNTGADDATGVHGRLVSTVEFSSGHTPQVYASGSTGTTEYSAAIQYSVAGTDYLWDRTYVKSNNGQNLVDTSATNAQTGNYYVDNATYLKLTYDTVTAGNFAISSIADVSDVDWTTNPQVLIAYNLEAGTSKKVVSFVYVITSADLTNTATNNSSALTNTYIGGVSINGVSTSTPATVYTSLTDAVDNAVAFDLDTAVATGITAPLALTKASSGVGYYSLQVAPNVTAAKALTGGFATSGGNGTVAPSAGLTKGEYIVASVYDGRLNNNAGGLVYFAVKLV